MPRAIFQLTSALTFPSPDLALEEPNGLLAYGGDLSCARLVQAYHNGIFPWFSDGDPVLWWSPDPRCVFYPAQFHPHQRFLRRLRHCEWQLSLNHHFDKVIERCASIKRQGQRGTWITNEMIAAYQALHRLGYAHSVEVWQEENLIGGIYGVALGRVFFGESMFSEVSEGSKTALTYLGAFLRLHDYALLDCQVPNPHLLKLGAQHLSRDLFLPLIQRETHVTMPAEMWQSQPLPSSLLDVFA